MLTYNFWENISCKNNKNEILRRKEIKKKSVIINVNFSENGIHGCKFKCNFCPWYNTNYNIYIYPSDDTVIEFLNKYLQPGCTVRICGGGDPLYNFEKNKDKLLHLISLISSLGYKVKINTKDYDALYMYYDSDYLKDIKAYTISTEVCSEKIKETVKKLTSTGKKVRISKILNFSSNTDTIDIKYLKEFLDFYNINSDLVSIVFRTNYVHPLTRSEINNLKTIFYEYLYKTKNNIRFSLNGNGTNFTDIQLTNNEVSFCNETEEQILYELKLKKEDIGKYFEEYKCMYLE